MSETPAQHWQRIGLRRGRFDAFDLLGAQYSGSQDGAGWHVTSQDRSGSVHDFWVADGALYGFALHLFDPEAGGNNTSSIWELADGEVKPAEKAAILAAVKEWETPPEVSPK